MAKKLHRLTAYNPSLSLTRSLDFRSVSVSILCLWISVANTMFDEGNFVTQRQRNKESSLTERSDPFEWFTIFGVGFIFHFIYYLRHSFFPRFASVFAFFFCHCHCHFNRLPVLWTIYVLLTPFQNDSVRYKFDFPRMPIFPTEHV